MWMFNGEWPTPRAYAQPVCPECIPPHQDRCPRGSLISVFSLSKTTFLPELPCICRDRLDMLKLQVRPTQMEPEPDHKLEAISERTLSEDSWPGSAAMHQRKHVLTISPALHPLEFNWYFLRGENRRRWQAYEEHQKTCQKSDNCDDPAHVTPDCPPEHAWMPKYRNFTNDVIRTLVAIDHPQWDLLACWRADLTYWIERLPKAEKRLFLLRLNDKDTAEIARITGMNRFEVRKRLQRLSYFLRHAADSRWDRQTSLRELVRFFRVATLSVESEGGEKHFAGNRGDSQTHSGSLSGTSPGRARHEATPIPA